MLSLMGMRQADAARVLGVTRQAIQDRIRKGTLRRLPDGTLDEAEVNAMAPNPARVQSARRGAGLRKAKAAAIPPESAATPPEAHELVDPNDPDLAGLDEEMDRELEKDGRQFVPHLRRTFVKALKPSPRADAAKAEAPTRQARAEVDEHTVAAHRLRREKAEADLAEMKAAQMRGTLIDRAAAEREAAEAATLVRDRLRMIPNRLRDQMAAESSARVCGELMAKAIDEALSTLAAMADGGVR